MFGLLGPNGSGKSTLLRILSTLLRPEAGGAHVIGHDVVREPDLVRRALGVVFQNASVDRKLTVEENLTCHASLYGLSGRALAERLDATLERLGLAARRSERVERLSGGLERRVELAKALLVGARVLLLDEPSTALDPGARRDFLGYLRELRDAAGLTVLLSTHDLEEAERCDRVAIFDAGRIVALGTPDDLKAAVGGDVLVIRATAPEALRERLAARLGLEVRLVDGTLRIERPRGHELVRDVVEAFPGEVRTVTVGKPTLGDVFVRLTGHGLAEA
jgi:ABC-2 type transport system ATP-binding protein